MAKFSMKVSEARAAMINTEIAAGSEPETRFYLMVAASSAIAAFGLIKDSTAIVIGAMLVAPLMTPIFGIALALVRGDAMLLKRSLQLASQSVDKNSGSDRLRSPLPGRTACQRAPIR